MKAELKKAIAAFEACHQRSVMKGDFTGVFGHAFLKASTLNPVKAAFWATRIHPYDPSVIKPEQMKPAKSQSVKGSFVLTQTSPIKVIMKSFRIYKPSSFDSNPSHSLLPSVSEQSHNTTSVASSSWVTLEDLNDLTEPDETHSPLSLAPSSHVRPHSPEIGPELLQDPPSKRFQIISLNLSATSSGSFLTSKTPYVSNVPYPHTPDHTPVTFSEPD
ncbi:hypothetical protein PM082_010722 [Marasmius tenuissimus]|nr:hypothetical protein PM082_010722 [Marasmius tenuissimus]